jgi:hypothetical protein
MHTPGDIERTRLRILVAMGEQVIDPDRAYELLRRVQIANSKIERLAASRRALLGRTCSFLFLCIAITRVFGAA